MRILAAVQGPYGRRKVANIRERGPEGWHIEAIELPPQLPLIIDEPEEFLPTSVSGADLLLHLGESPQAAQLIPALARRCGARSVLAPVDNSLWFPVGLQNQIAQELAADGVTMVCPKPFCSLTEDSYGYGTSARLYQDPVISEFAGYFGRPEFRVTLEPEAGLIESVEVLRGTPCGSTYYAA